VVMMPAGETPTGNPRAECLCSGSSSCERILLGFLSKEHPHMRNIALVSDVHLPVFPRRLTGFQSPPH
jgi:hypothetical protein